MLEKWMYSGSIALTGQSPTIVEELRERAPGKPVLLVTNGVDLRRFDQRSVDRTWRGRLGASDDETLVVYAGLHGVAQGLDQVLETANVLRDRRGVRFALIGDGPAKPDLMALASSLHLPNIFFQDSVEPEEIPGILGAADIVVVPLGFDLTGAVPSKLYEAMAASRPVILVGGGDGRGLVERESTGITCDIDDIDAIAEAVRYLSDHSAVRESMGKQARIVVERSFDRRLVAGELDCFLKARVQE
jgi:glycosyltransferase involved in cell wall biosynthesis